MRGLLSLSVLVSALSFCPFCFADTVSFSFVPVAGAAVETVSFTIPGVPDSYVVGSYSTYSTTGGTQFQTNSDLYIFYVDFYRPLTYVLLGRPQQDFDFAYTYYESPTLPVSGIYGFAGPQIYTGSEADPSFSPGVYTLSYEPLISAGYTDPPNNQTISLTISNTPEPSSLLLLGTGLAGALVLARRRLAAVAQGAP